MELSPTDAMTRLEKQNVYFPSAGAAAVHCQGHREDTTAWCGQRRTWITPGFKPATLYYYAVCFGVTALTSPTSVMFYYES